jgi:hypothetical protein
MQAFNHWKVAAALLAVTLMPLAAQDRRPQIDVDSYKIQVTIDPKLQSLSATAAINFTSQEESVSTVTFELHNSVNVTKVVDGSGRELRTNRNPQDFTIQVSYPEPLQKGKPATAVFTYSATFSGKEESPIYGIRFASIQNEYGYLLYPARWFPVSGYTADRYTMELKVTLPDGYRAVSSGLEKKDGSATVFQTLQPAFPGSIGIVKGEPVRVPSQGFTSEVWFRGNEAAMAKPIGDEVGRVMTYLTSLFGLAPLSTISVIETDSGAPNGYSAAGMLFLSPSGIGKTPGQRLLANQLTRQWFGYLMSPVTRNHIWISNGMAKYAEVLYQEHVNGPSVLEVEVRDLYVDAMTVTDAPVRQAARFEDYSPEFFALTGSKGAAVLNMLRGVMGDPAFMNFLKSLQDFYANKSISTDDVRKAAEATSGRKLQGFFIQWLESNGAPEFTMEYTVFRTQKGFRVMGKITQDLDTFSMPVDLKIETEGNPEMKKVDVMGTSTEFSVDTFGKPKRVVIDPDDKVLRMSPGMRVSVAIRRGEQFAEISDYNEALKEYQKALEVNRASSLAHYRVGEAFFLQGNYQSAANEFREAIAGDERPSWTVVWSHINLAKIFDVTQQRERAVNEYTQAVRTKDNTQGAQEEAAKYRQKPYERPDRN